MEAVEIIEEVKQVTRNIRIPEDTGLYLTGSLANPDKPFREESDIDIWLVSDIPDVIEVVALTEGSINTMIQSHVSMSSYEIEEQLPSEIMGHDFHILIPYFHPIPFELAEYAIRLPTKL